MTKPVNRVLNVIICVTASISRESTFPWLKHQRIGFLELNCTLGSVLYNINGVIGA